MLRKKRKPDIFTVVPLTQSLIQGMYAGNRNAALERLSKLQIPFPAQLPDIDATHQFPLNITRVNNNTLRNLLSYWSSQFARVNALLGVAKGRHKKLDRYVEREKKKRFRMIAPSTPRSKYVDAIWGEVQASTRIGKLEKSLDEAIQMEELLTALTRDFSTYVEVLQADMNFRMAEMKMVRAGG
jgi:hypothetical protein